MVSHIAAFTNISPNYKQKTLLYQLIHHRSFTHSPPVIQKRPSSAHKFTHQPPLYFLFLELPLSLEELLSPASLSLSPSPPLRPLMTIAPALPTAFFFQSWIAPATAKLTINKSTSPFLTPFHHFLLTPTFHKLRIESLVVYKKFDLPLAPSTNAQRPPINPAR